MIFVPSPIVTTQWGNGKQQQSKIVSYRGEAWVYENEAIFISGNTAKVVVVLFNPIKLSEQHCPKLWLDVAKSHLIT